ncbi:MAG: NAD-dependent epimerase/dehydratase family protein [Reyranella sp.]|jgi:nucleoside-diphosphate-sugar epimerase|nr:NAD-dependent epimerase/dehydratase family protein [Reyranella sp.]
MRVFLLGATGSIGSAVLRELTGRGHEILALARSDASAKKIVHNRAVAIRGNIEAPEHWVAALPDVDAIVHMACDFGGSMESTDNHLLDVLLRRLSSQVTKPRFIYTGGCWLFGDTGDTVATEETPFSPLPAFAWMVPHLQRVLASAEVDGLVIHPAMVYGGDGGVFRRFAHDARERQVVRVVGSESVQWPLVHCDDLADLYALVLDHAPRRSSYLGAAIDAFPVGRIARAFAHDVEIVSTDEIARDLGEWARGYACNQRLSGARARRDLGWAPKHQDPERDVLEFRA